MADAYNLMAAAYNDDQRYAETVARHVKDWETVAGKLAWIAKATMGFADKLLPNKPPSAALADAIEKQIVPV
jgi:hypothetical protein